MHVQLVDSYVASSQLIPKTTNKAHWDSEICSLLGVPPQCRSFTVAIKLTEFQRLRPIAGAAFSSCELEPSDLLSDDHDVKEVLSVSRRDRILRHSLAVSAEVH